VSVITFSLVKWFFTTRRREPVDWAVRVNQDGLSLWAGTRNATISGNWREGATGYNCEIKKKHMFYDCGMYW